MGKTKKRTRRVRRTRRKTTKKQVGKGNQLFGTIEDIMRYVSSGDSFEGVEENLFGTAQCMIDNYFKLAIDGSVETKMKEGLQKYGVPIEKVNKLVKEIKTYKKLTQSENKKNNDEKKKVISKKAREYYDRVQNTWGKTKQEKLQSDKEKSNKRRTEKYEGRFKTNEYSWSDADFNSSGEDSLDEAQKNNIITMDVQRYFDNFVRNKLDSEEKSMVEYVTELDKTIREGGEYSSTQLSLAKTMLEVLIKKEIDERRSSNPPVVLQAEAYPVDETIVASAPPADEVLSTQPGETSETKTSPDETGDPKKDSTKSSEYNEVMSALHKISSEIESLKRRVKSSMK